MASRKLKLSKIKKWVYDDIYLGLVLLVRETLDQAVLTELARIGNFIGLPEYIRERFNYIYNSVISIW